MPRFAVVTDSTADLAPEIAERHGVRVVPLNVSFGGESLNDGDLTQAEFFARMKAAPALPTTSQPPTGAFVDAFTEALAVADSVISVHISSKLSGTLSSARLAAERFGDKVHVFDSRNLSWALAFQVLDAARSAAEGLSAEKAIERLERVRDDVRLIVGLDNLENLARGGRIGNVSAFLGSLLNLKVTFTVDAEGTFQPLARTRGEKAALRQTLDWVAEQMGAATRGRFAVGHVMSIERASWLADEIKSRFDAIEMHIYEAGSVIATHTGTGWGVAVLPESSR
ncbi:MAG: DegV family protein [Coriobacteriales bacterium]|nr:DegV family protein [Coriobacteriales bacterium]